MTFPDTETTSSEIADSYFLPKQRTLKTEQYSSGKTLFSGVKVNLHILPAEENHGIIFQRIDLPHKPLIPAGVQYVKDTPRCTILEREGACVRSVEHILSVFKAFEIDNALIQVDGDEIPMGDGSAKCFVELIENCEISTQNARKEVFHLKNPVYWSQGDVHLVALPSNVFRISYTLNYSNSTLLGAQFYSNQVNKENFENEIALSRTFSLYEEIIPLLDKGIIKGGSLDNGVVIKDDEILNPSGLRFEDEMVRHKVLDLIGDLSLVGVPFCAHIISVRSGHASNTALAKEMVKHFKRERL